MLLLCLGCLDCPSGLLGMTQHYTAVRLVAGPKVVKVFNEWKEVALFPRVEVGGAMADI